MFDGWKSRAEKAGVSISKFVVDRVEGSIRKIEGEETYLTRLHLVEHLRKAEGGKDEADSAVRPRLADLVKRFIKDCELRSMTEKTLEGYLLLRFFDSRDRGARAASMLLTTIRKNSPKINSPPCLTMKGLPLPLVQQWVIPVSARGF